MAKHLVIMAGGIGSRFWPMSTPQCPKQFLDITGCGKTMIQQTFERYDGIIDIDHVCTPDPAGIRTPGGRNAGCAPRKKMRLLASEGGTSRNRL